MLKTLYEILALHSMKIRILLHQVKLELIRQAESLEQVREILEEGISEGSSSPADAS